MGKKADSDYARRSDSGKNKGRLRKRRRLLAFKYYVSKADALMEVPGMPDFVGIKSYLNRALFFATTKSLRQTAEARINQIDRMILFYKADVAATKGTRSRS